MVALRILYLGRSDAFDGVSSLVNIARGFFSYMQEADPEFYVQWVVPSGIKASDLADVKMHDPARLDFLSLLAGRSPRTLGYMLPQELWKIVSQAKVPTPYDVILNNQLALGPLYANVLANRFQGGRYSVETPMVNWQMWTATMQQLQSVPEYYFGEIDVLAESLASLYAWNLWESPILLASHLETMERWLKPTALEHIRQRSEITPPGIDTERLDLVHSARNERLAAGESGPCLFWGGRLANQKKVKTTFPLMERVRRQTDCKVLVTTMDADAEWVRLEFPEWEVHSGVNEHEFGEFLARGDVFLCNAASESYGAAWLEMLYVGLAGVYEEMWWNEHILPEDYPYRTPSRDEQVMTAIALIRNWPVQVHDFREWLKGQHDRRGSALRMLARMRIEHERAVAGARRMASNTMGRLTNQAAEEAWERWDSDEAMPIGRVTDRMTELSRTHRAFGRKGDPMSVMYLRRLLQAYGWRDIARSGLVELLPPGAT